MPKLLTIELVFQRESQKTGILEYNNYLFVIS